MGNYLHYIYNEVNSGYFDFLQNLSYHKYLEKAKGSIMIFGMKSW